jgi:hypothetical protein
MLATLAATQRGVRTSSSARRAETMLNKFLDFPVRVVQAADDTWTLEAWEV